MAARALKLAGVYFMLRAIMFIFNPGKILAVLNYPPEADAGGFGGFGKKAGPSDDEVKTIMATFTFYSIVQAGIAGLALSTARAGDAYTQSIVATGIGIISALISVIAYTSDIVAPGPETYKLLLPTVVSAVGLLAAGVPGVLSGKPSGQDIKMSGKVMAVIACFGVLQGGVLVFNTEKWLAGFTKEDAPEAHESTTKLLRLVAPMWGMCILCSALIRLAVVYAGHTASIYAVNRATVIYYTQLCGACAMAKVVGINDDAAMNKQIFAIMAYMMASYFGGTIADDEAAKAAAAAKEKVK